MHNQIIINYPGYQQIVSLIILLIKIKKTNKMLYSEL